MLGISFVSIVLCNGKYYFPPESQGDVPLERIFDSSAHAGMWAIEVVDGFESTMVVRTHMSPIQLEYVSHNTRFIFMKCKFGPYTFYCSCT
jgi:hypothetical protein